MYMFSKAAIFTWQKKTAQTAQKPNVVPVAFSAPEILKEAYQDQPAMGRFDSSVSSSQKDISYLFYMANA